MAWSGEPSVPADEGGRRQRDVVPDFHEIPLRGRDELAEAPVYLYPQSPRRVQAHLLVAQAAHAAAPAGLLAHDDHAVAGCDGIHLGAHFEHDA